MKRYLVLIAYEPWDWQHVDEDTRQEVFTAHRAFEADVAEHGEKVAGAALGDADTATTLRGPERTVTDGPFVESVEQVGGYYDVRLPDLDTAIAAARLLPASYTVEIRPVVGVEGYDEA